MTNLMHVPYYTVTYFNFFPYFYVFELITDPKGKWPSFSLVSPLLAR